MKKQILKISLLLNILIINISIAQIAATDQGFDDVENLPGWIFSNQSSPQGETDWFQGNELIMLAQDGDPNTFIAANYRNTVGLPDSIETICNYLIMPEIGNIESISFYTRSSIASNNFSIYPDRLYLVYSPTGEINTGNCTDDFGDFTETLLVVNPNLTQETTTPEGYPLTEWEQFSSEVNGNGRIAFVYYVDDAGYFGTNSNYIGIDTVEWTLAPLIQNKPLLIQSKLPK